MAGVDLRVRSGSAQGLQREYGSGHTWGIQSVTLGGPVWPVPADSDTVNEVCRCLHEHESFDEPLAQVPQAHARLVRAARNAPDLDKPCFQRATGEMMTGRQRLELLARHWAEHVRELQEAAKPR